MKTIIALILSLTLSIFYSQAQVIKGTVVDVDNYPVEYATVILQTTDSVYINSTITDSLGIFSFQSQTQPYRIIVQHMLYNTKELISNNSDAGRVVLDMSSHALGEVTVKAYRPVVTVVDGKLSYNMPNLLEGKVVSNAYESLLQIPGIYEQDGKIILTGSNSLSLIINGKASTVTIDQLVDLLKNMPQTRIKKAEVMYNAPPQYHIRGAAVNLVLDNYNVDDNLLQGQVNTSYRQRTYERANVGVTLLYSNKKFSTDFMYNFDNGSNYSAMDLYSIHSFEGKEYDIQQSNKGKAHSQKHNVRIGTDYKLSDQDKLSFSYTGKLNTSSNSTQTSSGTYSNSINHRVNDAPEQMHNLSLSYSSNFGLNTGVDYTYYNDRSKQSFRDTKKSGVEQFTTLSEQRINRFKIYADQENTLVNKMTLSYGGSFMFVSDYGKQTYEGVSGRNTDNRLDEYTYNLYGGFQKSFSEKISLSMSLAGEYYRLGDFKNWTLFPRLEMSYTPASDHLYQLSLSSDKQYPSYWEMQGAVSYINGYTEIHGNPSLRPYNDYNLQLSYMFKNRYRLSLYGSYDDNYFVQIPYQSSERLALIYKTTNFDYRKSLGASITVPFSLGNVVSSQLLIDGSYNSVKNDQFHDIAFDNQKWILYSNLSNSINISSKPNIKAELTGTYVSPFIQGPGQLSGMWMVNTGVKWIFADNKAELSLKGSNIFNTWKPDMKLVYANQNIRMKVYDDTRALTVTFSYKFGEYKNQNKNKRVDDSRFGQQ